LTAGFGAKRTKSNIRKRFFETEINSKCWVCISITLFHAQFVALINYSYVSSLDYN